MQNLTVKYQFEKKFERLLHKIKSGLYELS